MSYTDELHILMTPQLQILHYILFLTFVGCGDMFLITLC